MPEPVVDAPRPSQARTADFVDGLGPTLVVAPHPDDESIGCGGLIALLCERGVPVSVILLSDGSGSHPNSRRFAPAARSALRLGEMRQALERLGVAAPLIALGWPDGALPRSGEPGFAAAAAVVEQQLRTLAPATVLAPWRRDPHRDHRAASEIVRAARRACRAAGQTPPRLLEYGVWLAERAGEGDWPHPGETRRWPVDIGAVLARKQAAIAAHASQQGVVIDDDPDGFVLPASLLARAGARREHYDECVHDD